MKVMTMNKLDDKVIVDREVFVGILDMARRGLDSGFFGDVFHQDFAKGEQALAQDLTGWAAVPVEATGDMLTAVCAKNTDGYTLPLSYAEAHSAMLEASPQLPGGVE